MPCRGEMSKRINFAFAVTERKENRTLREKSRFAGAKRFALQSLEKRGICWQSPTLITSERGAPLKAQVPDTRQARYSVAALLTASTTEKVLKQKVSRLFSFSKTAVKIMHDHMFDHLRIFLCFYVLGIAAFLQKIKNSFSLFTAYQNLHSVCD